MGSAVLRSDENKATLPSPPLQGIREAGHRGTVGDVSRSCRRFWSSANGRSRRRPTCLALALAGILPIPGQAQELHSFGPDPLCSCRIVLRRVAVLGRLDDTVAISISSFVARSSAGRFLVAPVSPQGTVAVLDSVGKLRSTLGRAGRGPGELYSIRYVATTPGDSVLVLDYLRMTLFDPAGRFVRSANLPTGLSAFRFAVLPDGRVVINNYLPTRRSFSLLDPSYREIRSFGRSIAGDDFPDSDALQFVLVALDSGRFAAVQQNHHFLVQIWDTAGATIREFRRSPEWFSAWSYRDKLARGTRAPPFPRVISAYADLARRELWIIAGVPDARWKSAVPPAAAARGRREIPGATMVPIQAYDRAFDTVIEVLDMDTGRVLVAQRFDADISYFMEGGLLYNIREDSSGLFVIDVWRAEVAGHL